MYLGIPLVGYVQTIFGVTLKDVADVAGATASAFAIVGLFIAARQFSLARKSADRQTVVGLYTAFWNMYAPITPGDVENALLHGWENWDPEVFAEEYAGSHARIRSYLLMKRKYTFMYHSLEVREHIGEKALNHATWIEELVGFHEFRHVHARHGKYYGTLKQLVDGALVHGRAPVWLCEVKPFDAEYSQWTGAAPAGPGRC